MASDQKFAVAAAFWVSSSWSGWEFRQALVAPDQAQSRSARGRYRASSLSCHCLCRASAVVIKDIWRLCPLGLRVACSMSEKKLCIVDDLSLDSFISS